MLVIAPHAARVYATQYSCFLLFACFDGEKKYLCPASVTVWLYRLYTKLQLHIHVGVFITFFCLGYQSHMAVNERSLFKSVAS